MPAPAREWSLTRRLALSFAVTTSTVLALYAGLSAYFVFDGIRDHTRAFMEHELAELGLVIQATDGAPAALEKSLADVLEVTKDRRIALRIRDTAEKLLLEGGDADLLQRVRRPLERNMSWRKWFFTRQVAVQRLAIDRPPLVLEILVDTGDAVEDIADNGLTALVAFLAAAVLAALAGLWNAHRGLRSLRQVVAQARAIESPADITRIEVDGAPAEVREVGRALNAMLARIESGMADIRTFTAGLAHELRSPIQNLVGATEVTLLQDRSGEEYRQLLRSNLDDLHELTAAVDNLVAFCRSNESLERDLRAEEFDLHHEVDLSLEGLRRAAARAGVRLEVARQGDTRLEADREGCMRVAKNLVWNAIQHSPRGGAVRVCARGDADTVRLEVEDDGPGIPAELADRIFEPFFSLKRTDGRRSGYGLGLFICRTIVAAHGGRIALENGRPRGSRFVAEFPRRRADERAARAR